MFCLCIFAKFYTSHSCASKSLNKRWNIAISIKHKLMSDSQWCSVAWLFESLAWTVNACMQYSMCSKIEQNVICIQFVGCNKILFKRINKWRISEAPRLPSSRFRFVCVICVVHRIVLKLTYLVNFGQLEFNTIGWWVQLTLHRPISSNCATIIGLFLETFVHAYKCTMKVVHNFGYH